MKRQLFSLLSISLAVLPLVARELEKKIAGVYLEEAVRMSDANASLLLIEKALEFDPSNSDALYWAATLSGEKPSVRLSLLKKAVLADTWVLVRPNQGLALYLGTLAQTKQFSLLLREMSPYRSQIDRSADLLYPYVLALKAEGSKESLESAIQTAWLLYQSDARFWSFFLERDQYFLPFFDYLKQIESFPVDVLHDLLSSLPKSEAERHALLLMLKNKSEEDLTLILYLSLNGLIAQDEALYLLKARGDVWDLGLHKLFYESLQDPLLKEEYQTWLAHVTGTFYWISEGAQEVDNWASVANGDLVDWSYVNAWGGRDTIRFREAQPSSFSQNGDTTINYGIYPFVQSITVKKDKDEISYRLGTGLLSLPLVESTFLSSLTIPLFLPLQMHLISYNLRESFWMPYTIKMEVFQGENLTMETEYLHGKPTRRSFVNSLTGKFDRWDFYDNGILTNIQRDLDGDDYPEVLVVYTAENQGLYTLLDYNKDGLTEFLYFKDAEGIVEYWDWFDRGQLDTIVIKDILENPMSQVIPLSDPEAEIWLQYPKFQLRDW